MQRTLKYQTIAEDVFHQNILGGDGLLPSEQSLAKKYETTRTTIRRALGVLKDRGVLESRHGSGNFSKLHNFENDLFQLRRMPEKFAHMGIPYNAEILPITVIKSNEDIAESLRITVNDEVYEVVRLFRHENKVLLIEKGYLPVSLFPSLTEEDVKVKLDFFEQKTTYKVIGAFQHIIAVAADSWLAERFHISTNTPILSIQLRVRTNKDVIISYDTQFYHPDFVMENTIPIKKGS